MECFDVVIVGSGPAGSATAKMLTAEGIKVLMVEKEKLPRYKICSGIIAPTVQNFVKKHFGEIPENSYSQPHSIKGMKAVRSDGSIIETPPLDGKVRILSVWRKTFDNWLAQTSGAVLLDECRFKNVERKNGLLCIACVGRVDNLLVNARYLVGADGGSSAVRRIIRQDFDEQKYLAVAYEEHWTGTADVDPEYFYIFLDGKFCEFPMAAFSVKDDCFVVVSSVWKGSDVRKFHKRFMDYLKAAYGFRPEKLVRSGGCLANVGSCKGHYEVGDGNILLVGEAGGFLGGKTEGITPALYTGHAAALAILESIKSGGDAVSYYSKITEQEKERIRIQQKHDKEFVMPIPSHA